MSQFITLARQIRRPSPYSEGRLRRMFKRGYIDDTDHRRTRWHRMWWRHGEQRAIRWTEAFVHRNPGALCVKVHGRRR